MTYNEAKAIIIENLTRVGSNRISSTKIREAVLIVLDYAAAIDNEDIIPLWTNALIFQTDGTDDGKYCKHPDANGKQRIFETKVEDNVNHEPPTDPNVQENIYWEEISAAGGSAITEWMPGLYGAGLQIRYHNHSADGRGLYLLDDATRPFTSVNIETEITEGKWKRLHPSKRLKIFDTAPANIILDVENAREMMFKANNVINQPKTWQFLNHANVLVIQSVRFPIDGPHPQSFPENVKMQMWVGDWSNLAHQWTPQGAGDYEADLTYDGETWYMKIYGPF